MNFNAINCADFSDIQDFSDIENLEEEGLSPGNILIYRQGANTPRMLSSDNVPIDFQYEENALLNEFVSVSGVNDLLKSSAISSGNVSGVALQLLIEQDEIKMISSAEEIKNSAKEIAKHILRLYKQFAIVEHTSRIIGDNGNVELFYWKGSDINSEEIIFESFDKKHILVFLQIFRVATLVQFYQML